MKEKVTEVNGTYPENPPWTMFFDGPLYQEYDKFMKTKDFSQILLNTKLRLANKSQSPEAVNPAYTLEDHWNNEHDADPTGSTYQYVSEDYYQRINEDEKRRTRRTRAFIIISLVTMAALAFGTALVIHYIFIEPFDEASPKKSLNVSFSGNITTTTIPEITTTVPVDSHTDRKPLLIEDLLKGPTHDAHDHSTHDHSHGNILNPDGKIFDDNFITTTEAASTSDTTVTTTVSTSTPPTSTTVTTSMSTSTPPSSTTVTTTVSTSTPPTSTTTAEYVLNLNPYSEPDSGQGSNNTKNKSKVTTTTRLTSGDKKPKKDPTSTTHIDPMDFFGMDEFPTTTQSLNTSLSDADFFAIDDYYYDVTTSKSNASARITTDIPETTSGSKIFTDNVTSSGISSPVTPVKETTDKVTAKIILK